MTNVPQNQNAGYEQYNRGVDRQQRYEQGWETIQQKQQELKERLQQRYRQLQRSNSDHVNKNTYGYSEVNSVENDILSRATANVMENAEDELERQMEADNFGNLMREVSDLMITGYQADISFERDFLAEGMELLNRYEIGNM